jgi:chromosome partitioning protein
VGTVCTVRPEGQADAPDRPASSTRAATAVTLPGMRLAVCSSKGGVGKTATAANLAVALARRGRVLAVDTDPQDSLGRAFGVVAKGRDDSLAALLEDPITEARAAIRHDVVPGLDLLPAHPALEAVSVQLAGTGGLVTSIRRGLRPLLDEYDHILLDTRGDLGGLTLAAVCAADTVLTVFTSDPGSALGVVRVAAFLEQHRTYENTSAVLLGVACVAWDKEGRAAREVLGALEGTGLPLLETRVPMSRRVPTSALAKRPVVLSAPSSPVACAYLTLADEVLTLAERLHR